MVLVTKDTNLRIKADAVGLIAQDYTTDKVDIADLYPGVCEVWVDAAQMDRVKGEAACRPPNCPRGGCGIAAAGQRGVMLVDPLQPSHTLLARFDAADGALHPLQRAPKVKLGRVQARNREQTFRPGSAAGSGGAAGDAGGQGRHRQDPAGPGGRAAPVADERRYDRLLVTRPVISLGKELGFLPGDLEEKMGPWMQPIIDNLDFLLGGEERGSLRGTQRGPRNSWADLKGMACWKWRRSATSAAARFRASSWWWMRRRTSPPTM